MLFHKYPIFFNIGFSVNELTKLLTWSLFKVWSQLLLCNPIIFSQCLNQNSHLFPDAIILLTWCIHETLVTGTKSLVIQYICLIVIRDQISYVMTNSALFANTKTKAHISCAIKAQLISVFFSLYR